MIIYKQIFQTNRQLFGCQKMYLLSNHMSEVWLHDYINMKVHLEPPDPNET